MTLTELIAALEAADGPSGELDAEIANLLGLTTSYWPGKEWEYRDGGEWRPLPAYTASLDAAVTLVPEGCSYTIYVNGDGHPARRHPALALCIVALKAREAME